MHHKTRKTDFSENSLAQNEARKKINLEYKKKQDVTDVTNVSSTKEMIKYLNEVVEMLYNTK